MTKKPNLFILGAPKCGTTSLQEYLAQHPHVFMCRPKEPRYFDDDLALPKSAKKRDEREYTRLFAKATDEHLIIGEASTTYLYSSVAVRNILAFNPDARFIVSVRNPIDMAMSLHAYAYQELREDVRSFEQAWRLQSERAQGRLLPKAVYEKKFALYGPFCRLGEQLRSLYAQIPRERVHVVVFDDLCADPGREYRNILGFLGICDDERSAFPIRNTTGLPRSRRVHAYLASLLAIRYSLPIPELGIHLFPKLVKLNLKPKSQRVIPPGFREELVEYFSDDVELLSGLLGRDLSCWLMREDALPMES